MKLTQKYKNKKNHQNTEISYQFYSLFAAVTSLAVDVDETKTVLPGDLPLFHKILQRRFAACFRCDL